MRVLTQSYHSAVNDLQTLAVMVKKHIGSFPLFNMEIVE